jgi:hypothetical protein
VQYIGWAKKTRLELFSIKNYQGTMSTWGSMSNSVYYGYTELWMLRHCLLRKQGESGPVNTINVHYILREVYGVGEESSYSLMPSWQPSLKMAAKKGIKLPIRNVNQVITDSSSGIRI